MLPDGRATQFRVIWSLRTPMDSLARLPREGESRDALWRPLDPHNDRYLRWESDADRDLWQTVKNGDICLYYWLPDYWLIRPHA